MADASADEDRRFRLISLAICCLLAIGTGYYYFALFLPHAHSVRVARQLNGRYVYGCDLHPIWLASRELFLHRENPYTPEMSRRNQVEVYGRLIDPQRPEDPLQNFGIYPYPIYTSFLIAPLAAFSFSTVQTVGTGLFPMLAGLSTLLWLSFLKLRLRPPVMLAVLILTCATYPVLEGFYALQITLVVALLLAGTAVALAKGRLPIAGVLLGAASVKPQLVLLIAAWLILWAASDLRKRKAFLLSLVATIALLVLGGEVLLPGWTLSWIRALYQYRHYNQAPLAQLVLGKTAGIIFCVVLLAIAALLGFRTRSANAGSAQFAATFVVMLAITVPVFPSSIAVYDQILLAPSILWLLFLQRENARKTRASRILGAATIATISWQWVGACLVALLSLARPGIGNTWWVLLPVRATASIPFAVAGLSLWLLWENLRLAKSPARSGSGFAV